MADKCAHNHSRCRLKKTVLLVGEGPCEWAFLKHLVSLFQFRESAFAARVENAHGGSPETVLLSAKKLLRQRAYDVCVIVMDTDRPWPSILSEHIGKTRMKYVAASPCLEGLLLQMLGVPGITMRSSVAQCKRVLYDTHVDENHRTEPNAYVRSFSRDVLTQRRTHCDALDVILRELH
jgi:hypothetical protein